LLREYVKKIPLVHLIVKLVSRIKEWLKKAVQDEGSEKGKKLFT
jgi:hypothetical protein